VSRGVVRNDHITERPERLGIAYDQADPEDWEQGQTMCLKCAIRAWQRFDAMR
jgi:hypothetical protein